MFLKLFLAFTLVPFIEIYLLIKIGGAGWRLQYYSHRNFDRTSRGFLGETRGPQNHDQSQG